MLATSVLEIPAIRRLLQDRPDVHQCLYVTDDIRSPDSRELQGDRDGFLATHNAQHPDA
jgi:hypothetical protein